MKSRTQEEEEKTMKTRNLLLSCAITFSMIVPAIWAGMPDDIRNGTYLELEGNLVADKLVMAMDIEVRNTVLGDAVVSQILEKVAIP